MTLLKAVAGLLILCCAITPALAKDDCGLTAKVNDAAAHSLYNPFSPSDTVLNLDVSLTNSGSRACQAQFYIAPIDGRLDLASGPDRLLFRVDAPNSGGAGQYGPFIAQVPPGATRSLPIRFVVSPQQVVRQGDYTAELMLRGLSQDNSPLKIEGGEARLYVRVLPRLEMSISGTAAASLPEASMQPASIEFGEMKSGQTGHVFVNVWANSSVAVSLASENHGFLKLLDHPSLSPISYAARFDGRPISLTAPYVTERTPPLSIRGASYELAITLGDVSQKFAGRYQDVITVSVNQN